MIPPYTRMALEDAAKFAAMVWAVATGCCPKWYAGRDKSGHRFCATCMEIRARERKEAA